MPSFDEKEKPTEPFGSTWAKAACAAREERLDMRRVASGDSGGVKPAKRFPVCPFQVIVATGKHIRHPSLRLSDFSADAGLRHAASL